MGLLVVTEFVRPNGDKRRIEIEVDDDILDIVARNRMSLSVERIFDNVALYGRREDQPEDDEECIVVPNGPGLKESLIVLIKKLAI
jgi:hypothetical protein